MVYFIIPFSKDHGLPEKAFVRVMGSREMVTHARTCTVRGYKYSLLTRDLDTRKSREAEGIVSYDGWIWRWPNRGAVGKLRPWPHLQVRICAHYLARKRACQFVA